MLLLTIIIIVSLYIMTHINVQWYHRHLVGYTASLTESHQCQPETQYSNVFANKVSSGSTILIHDEFLLIIFMSMHMVIQLVLM